MKNVLVNRRIGNKSGHPRIVLCKYVSKLLSPVPLTLVQPLLENGGALVSISCLLLLELNPKQFS